MVANAKNMQGGDDLEYKTFNFEKEDGENVSIRRPT